MKRKTSIVINAAGDEIDYEIDFDEHNGKKPVVLFLHGFRAFKDWGFYPYLCQRIAESGGIAVRFSFSLSGVKDSRKMVYDAEKFSRNTMVRELSDARLMIEKIVSRELFENLGIETNGDIYVAGHSRGGALAILLGSEFEEIKKISAFAAVSSFDRYSERQKKIWLENGKFEFIIHPSKQKLWINREYLQDIIDEKEKYDIPKAAGKLKVPLQIIHGKQDKMVTIKEAYDIAYKYQDKSYLDFVTLEHSSHGFGAAHPFDKTNEGLEELITRLINFLELKQ